MKFYWLALIYILLLVSCDRPSDGTEKVPLFKEEQLDSIFEAFEDMAYSHPEKYVSNPDSFFKNLPVQAESPYQQEMYAYGLVFMGYSLLVYGDNFESIKYYEKAYDYVRSNHVKIANINTEIIKPLANLYIRINDTQKSVVLLQTALAETKNNEEIVGLANNLANAYLYNSELEHAKALLYETLERPSSSLSKALLYNTLASIYEEKQDYKNSLRYNSQAIKRFEENKLVGDTMLWYIGALGLQGDLQHDDRRIDYAIGLAEKNFPNAQNRFKAKLALLKADVLRKSNRYPIALKTYERTLRYFSPQTHTYILDYTYTQALIGKARIFSTQHQIDSALYYYQWAIENDFRTQQLIVSASDQLRNNILNKETIEELLQLLQAYPELRQQNTIVQQLLWCIELSKARLLINEINRAEQWNNASDNTKKGIQRIRELYYKIDTSSDQKEKKKLQDRIKQVTMEFQLSERYFESLRFEPQKAHFLKQLNRPNSDFYAYFIHNDSSVSIIQKLNKEFYWKKVSTKEPLQRLIAFKGKYFGNTPNNYNKNPLEYKEEARYLAEQFLPEIKKAQRNIFISLDAQLYGFPFDALYDERFLVTDHNLAYLNSFLLFDFLSDTCSRASAIAILFRSDYPKPLPNLQFVRQEVKNIGRKFPIKKIDPKKQNDFTIRKQFAQSHIIHIAAHTLLDTATAPVIYLNQAISTNQLRFYEMKAPLVFLSACNTGHGRPLPSEGTESIQRVFLSKNIPSVVSTFWFANDQAMLNLTTSFYEQLSKAGDPIAALAESKRLFLQSADPAQQNPWYWANINYTGVGNKIGLKKSSNLPLYILATGVLLALLIESPLGLWLYKTFENKDKKTNDKTK